MGSCLLAYEIQVHTIPMTTQFVPNLRTIKWKPSPFFRCTLVAMSKVASVWSAFHR